MKAVYDVQDKTPLNLQKQIKPETQLQSDISRRLSLNSSGHNVNGVIGLIILLHHSSTCNILKGYVKIPYKSM